MRLLTQGSAGEFIFTEDFINDVPRYAILSHTWGLAIEEVTYRDIIDGVGASKAGYSKIRFCAEQAKHDNLQFFWIDTCCIDKSNNTELTEAINSMFKWYRNAAICYVYLSDVSSPVSISLGTPDLLELYSAFRNSRWFTRGWTLQELLASRIVRFFSKECRALGDKTSLAQDLHDITGIAPEALRGDWSLARFSLDERMSWAKGRQTTRQEDTAYCLLGIFGVHIPLIYGEGQERAMDRLLKEAKAIQKGSLDLSPDIQEESRPRKSLNSSFNDAPVDLLSIHFIERERELRWIQQAHRVSEDCTPTRCAIWGTPGVGKTQLAIRYSREFLEDTTVSAVFWVSCSNMEKVYQGFSKILNLVDHPDQFQAEQSARVIAARRWLEQPRDSGILRWLLVLDDVKTKTIDFLRENLPRQGKQGRILVTTQTKVIADAICKASGKIRVSHELEPPTAEEATTFFLNSAGLGEESMSHTSRGQVNDWMKWLGCLPFAIEHAASFMAQSAQSVDSFNKMYQSTEKIM